MQGGFVTLCRKATAWFPIAITNKRDAVIPSSRLTDPTSNQEVRECYVGDSPQPTREEYGKGSVPPRSVRLQARLTKTVKASHRVAETRVGPDRRFLLSHTRVSLISVRMLRRWVCIQQHPGSLSTGSSAGRPYQLRKGGSMYSQATVKCEWSTKRCLTEKATLKRWTW